MEDYQQHLESVLVEKSEFMKEKKKRSITPRGKCDCGQILVMRGGNRVYTCPRCIARGKGS